MKFLVSGHGSIRNSIKFGFQIWCVGVTKLECVTGEGRARERIWLYERLRSNDFETRGRVASTRLNFPFLFLHQLYALSLPMAGHTESVLPLHVIDLAENDRHLLAQKVKKALPFLFLCSFVRRFVHTPHGSLRCWKILGASAGSISALNLLSERTCYVISVFLKFLE